jgi:hypothetical protein
MSTWIWLLVGVGVAAAAAVLVRRYLAYRGARLVECPESKQTAAVKVESAWAALGGDWRLADCSRWPERHACGRECITQIERSPDDCLVRTIVNRWYADKTCAVCGKALGEIDWYDRKPALMDEAGRSHPWPEVQADTLPQVLATHRPVCFDCYVAETFRQEHPDLVLDNPWTEAPNRQ